MPADTAYGSHSWGSGASGDHTTSSPDKCPQAWTDTTTKIDKVALTALNMARVPYYLIKVMADKDYTTCGDIGDRFSDPADVLNLDTITLLQMPTPGYSKE